MGMQHASSRLDGQETVSSLYRDLYVDTYACLCMTRSVCGELAHGRGLMLQPEKTLPLLFRMVSSSAVDRFFFARLF